MGVLFSVYGVPCVSHVCAVCVCAGDDGTLAAKIAGDDVIDETSMHIELAEPHRVLEGLPLAELKDLLAEIRYRYGVLVSCSALIAHASARPICFCFVYLEREGHVYVWARVCVCLCAHLVVCCVCAQVVFGYGKGR